MNLIPAGLQAEISSAMTNIFDSFARNDQITFYKVAAEEVVVFDPNYNSAFPEMIQSNKTVQSQAFTCRIWYLDRQPFSTFIEGGDDIGVSSQFYHNRIRLQCKEDAFTYLKDTERFVFLSETYQIEETWQRVGTLGSFQFYEVVLKRVN